VPLHAIGWRGSEPGAESGSAAAAVAICERGRQGDDRDTEQRNVPEALARSVAAQPCSGDHDCQEDENRHSGVAPQAEASEQVLDDRVIATLLGDDEPGDDVEREASTAEDHQPDEPGSKQERIDVQVVGQAGRDAADDTVPRASPESARFGRLLGGTRCLRCFARHGGHLAPVSATTPSVTSLTRPRAAGPALGVITYRCSGRGCGNIGRDGRD
jgi:hypothetical protein